MNIGENQAPNPPIAPAMNAPCSVLTQGDGAVQAAQLTAASTGAATGQNVGAVTAESRPQPETPPSNASLPAFLPGFMRSGPIGDILTRLAQMLSWVGFSAAFFSLLGGGLGGKRGVRLAI